MFKKWLFIVIALLGLIAPSDLMSAKHKKYGKAKHAKNISVGKHKKSGKKSASKSSHKSKKKAGKKGKKHRSVVSSRENALDKNKRAASQEMIAQNQEKKKFDDSVHKVVFANVNKDEEGYFAAYFSHQKQAASFQTIEGTAAVFKSVSGWQDKKFYILTNEIPVGTLVRITTPDLKSICAKVISALPDVSSSIKYRLNDAAAAILGITNKTFQISVTY
jgi:hypothetical protein